MTRSQVYEINLFPYQILRSSNYRKALTYFADQNLPVRPPTAAEVIAMLLEIQNGHESVARTLTSLPIATSSAVIMGRGNRTVKFIRELPDEILKNVHTFTNSNPYYSCESGTYNTIPGLELEVPSAENVDEYARFQLQAGTYLIGEGSESKFTQACTKLLALGSAKSAFNIYLYDDLDARRTNYHLRPGVFLPKTQQELLSLDFAESSFGQSKRYSDRETDLTFIFHR